MFNSSERSNIAPSGSTFAISAVLHLVAGIGLVYLAQTDTTPPRPLFRPPKSTLVYVSVAPVEIPAIKLAEFTLPAREIVVADEPAPPPPMPEVAPIFESRRAELSRPVELPVEPPPMPAPVVPAPRSPEVTVGAFANAPAAPVRTPEPARQIEIAGFDRAEKPAIEMKAATTAAVAFDRNVAANPRTESPQPTTIADAGFNRSAIVMAAAPQGKLIRETGFGNTDSREKPRAAEAPAQIAQVSFDTVRAPKPVSQAVQARLQPQVVQVEVLFKPTPIYTDEARKLGIEGNVLLEVEFLSTGNIRILRVVRGLGYGLDEAAIRAAEQIRFKPALDSGGHAVDSQTTVTIVFRLA